MLELGRELLRVVGLGERSAVDRARADPGDHVEPVAPFDDQMLAGSDLPACLRPATREDQRSSHARTWSRSGTWVAPNGGRQQTVRLLLLDPGRLFLHGVLDGVVLGLRQDRLEVG